MNFNTESVQNFDCISRTLHIGFMRIPKYISTLALIVESLKKDILSEYGLSWTEYLVLCLVNQFEMKDINPTPAEVIKASGKNRGWIYRTIRKLDKESFIFFSEGRPFEAGRIYMGSLGIYTLIRINTDLAQRIREIRKDSNRCISVEDGI